MLYFYFMSYVLFSEALDHKESWRSGRKFPFSIFYISFYVTFPDPDWSYYGLYILHISYQDPGLDLIRMLCISPNNLLLIRVNLSQNWQKKNCLILPASALNPSSLWLASSLLMFLYIKIYCSSTSEENVFPLNYQSKRIKNVYLLIKK